MGVLTARLKPARSNKPLLASICLASCSLALVSCSLALASCSQALASCSDIRSDSDFNTPAIIVFQSAPSLPVVGARWAAGTTRNNALKKKMKKKKG